MATSFMSLVGGKTTLEGKLAEYTMVTRGKETEILLKFLQ